MAVKPSSDDNQGCTCFEVKLQIDGWLIPTLGIADHNLIVANNFIVN